MLSEPDSDWIAVPASAGPDVVVPVLMDVNDAEALAGRSLSIGSHGYAQVWNPPQGLMLLHRWIMSIPAGTRYSIIVDHINRDILDCRRVNLRKVTPSESNLNRAAPDRELPLGVYRIPSGRYSAKLKRNRITVGLGTFNTIEEASEAIALAQCDPKVIQGAINGVTPRIVITDEQIYEIRSKYATGGITLKVIGEEYGIHLSTVHLIVKFRGRYRLVGEQ